MGYYTKYELETSGPNQIAAHKAAAVYNEATYYAIYDEQSCKWYDHVKDMKEISRKYPEVLFTLSGIGEEYPDIWVKYFKNGNVQVEKAVITFGECKL